MAIDWALGRLAAILLLLTSCRAPPADATPEPRGFERPARECRYDVTLIDPATATVEVEARCDGDQVRGFIASEKPARPHLEVWSKDGAPLSARGGRFALPDEEAVVHYRIALDAVARDARDIDVSFRSEDAWVVALSTILLRPDPVGPRALARVHFHLPADLLATGLERDEHSYRLPARDIGHATYVVLGRFERTTIELPGPVSTGPSRRDRAELELVTLPGPLSVDARARIRWMEKAAQAVSEFWHGFPVERALVVLIPSPGHEGVVYGKVVATGGATVAIHLGSHAREASLYRDWILLHELFHLGVPSFAGEGKWLDEGLATYYEPIIAQRAGWRSDRAVWREFAFDMAQGLSAVETIGVEREKSFSGIYWGGAILALMADVRIRQRTKGRLGLEDGLRAVLARGGNATQLWKLERVIATVDEALGMPVLADINRAHAYRGTPVNLPGIFRDLGVTRVHGGVRLDDDARLAFVRRAILEPQP